MIIGFYPVVGDLLHAGHVIAIEEAKANCDYLIVGLNCTPDGKTPIQSIYERFMQLRAVKFIDEIIPYQGRKDLELLASSLNYSIRFLGDDYRDKDWDGKEIEARLNKIPHYLHRQHYLSSSELKERILHNN
jgi:glycerol-3-phosphate cytidylyltransferase